ncbi:MAG: glucokinase [Coriobacteriia bacterium]|nr:glucokinase [Coriobacteriia bacterium]
MVEGDRLVVAFDVGATNTRARAAFLTREGLRPHTLLGDGVSEQVSSRERLYDFVWRILDSLREGERVVGAAFAAAGPVQDHARVTMTNWMETRPILLEELADLGLPRAATALMNDLEAGALGLLAMIEAEGPRPKGTEVLHDPPVLRRGGHFVFVAPGTGLGAAGIVEAGDGGGEGPCSRVVVPCEVQHTLLPPIDEEIGRVAERIAKDSRRDWVSWEDVVSGRGLLDAYAALCSLSGLVPIVSAVPEAGQEESAHVSAIAQAAVSGEDTMCAEAMDIYYRCLGAFCQSLALTFLPCAGVYVGGDTTRRNRDFLVGSGLLQTFLANPVHGGMLEAVPVRLVLRETNLAGGLRRAEEMARVSPA